MYRFLTVLSLFLISSATISAQSRKTIDTSTDILMFVPGAIGAGISLYKHDYKGFWQLAGSGATAIATSYLLKHTIKKEDNWNTERCTDTASSNCRPQRDAESKLPGMNELKPVQLN